MQIGRARVEGRTRPHMQCSNAYSPCRLDTLVSRRWYAVKQTAAKRRAINA
jgi:hypothetical protein